MERMNKTDHIEKDYSYKTHVYIYIKYKTMTEPRPNILVI